MADGARLRGHCSWLIAMQPTSTRSDSKSDVARHSCAHELTSVFEGETDVRDEVAKTQTPSRWPLSHRPRPGKTSASRASSIPSAPLHACIGYFQSFFCSG